MTDASSNNPTDRANVTVEPKSVAAKGEAGHFQVLARKYRPQDFEKLIGQPALVRTLSNAIRENRIAHAFVLTGVRGVGKTTTARIIARALNCVGSDGTGGPTVHPCGACQHCIAIAQSRHVDVLEMDAASRTGVNDIRELLDGVMYLPVSARFKVYIIDEVHMLSNSAFNALLKTLEEPPAHVKFIFATTEIRKVPVTVLSRCQRFDLKRVDADSLVQHFRWVLGQEQAEAEDAALALIARAAQGSVRDGLSLLDQAIAHGGGRVAVQEVRDMLGLADRARVFDLFDAAMSGDIKGALGLLQEQYDLGADPAVVLQDLLELTHWVTRLKVVPDAGDDLTIAEDERRRGTKAAAELSMAALARTWQMLLKGLGEVRAAPTALAAAEMVLVRLAYTADLPTPGEVIQDLRAAAEGRSVATTRGAAAPASGGNAFASARGRSALQSAVDVSPRQEAPPDRDPVAEAKPAVDPPPADFATLVEKARAANRSLLSSLLRTSVRLVRYEPGRIEFRPVPGAPADLAQMLNRELAEWTGRRWVLTVNNEAPGAPALAEVEAEEASARQAQAAGHPLVLAAMQVFPGARIKAVRNIADAANPAGVGHGTEGDEDR